MRTPLFLLLFTASSALMAQDRAVQEFHANGRLKSTRYSMGQQEWFITYHPNGRVEEMGGFVAGMPDGEWKQFDDRGHLQVQARFDQGRRVGTWSFAALDGTRGQLQFKNGWLQEGAAFDAQGVLIASKTY